MSRTILSVIGLVLLTGSIAWAQPQPQPRPPDPFGEGVFPPELVTRFAQEIGLTEEQKKFFAAELAKVQARFQELQQQLMREVQAMAALLKEERPNVEKTLAQLDKVLGVEREMKRAHLALIIGIKNKLTAAQQAQLQELRQKMGPPPGGPGGPGGPGAPPPGPSPTLPQKMLRVDALTKQAKEAGQDMAPVNQIMQGFEPLMKEQKFAEAEALLDRVLDLVGQGEKK